MFFEKRDDPELQITEGSHRIPMHCFPMIVVSVVTTNLSASEEPLHEVKHLDALLSLNHCERRLNLPTCAARVISKDWNAEAAFAVDETDDPLRETWPFLLIVRTGRNFTTPAHTIERRCNNTDEYRRILGVSSI
jgi:hypothetical protein